MGGLKKAGPEELELSEWMSRLSCSGQGAALRLGNKHPDLKEILCQGDFLMHLALTFTVGGFSKLESIVATVTKVVGEDEDAVIVGVSEWSRQPEKKLGWAEDPCGVVIIASNELFSKIWDKCFGGKNGETLAKEVDIFMGVSFAFAMSDEEVAAVLDGTKKPKSWTFYRLITGKRYGEVIPYSTFAFLRLNGLFREDKDDSSVSTSVST